MSRQEIICGDAVAVLASQPEASFDACITDSPYGLKLMSNRWDYQVPSPEAWAAVLRVLKPGAAMVSFGGRRTYHRVAAAIEDGGFEIVDQMTWIFGGGFPKTKDALKPAHDSIVVARRPGGRLPLVRVDGNRIAFQSDADRASAKPQGRSTLAKGRRGLPQQGTPSERSDHVFDNGDGRWPATIEISCACEGSRHAPECAVAVLDDENGLLLSKNAGVIRRAGGASRFFNVSQARMGERAGNPHPTVKPLALVRRLVRLFSAPTGRVLDPFAGSCTTAVACAIEDRECLAVEREERYCEIGRKRLAQGSLDFSKEVSA